VSRAFVRVLAAAGLVLAAAGLVLAAGCASLAEQSERTAREREASSQLVLATLTPGSEGRWKVVADQLYRLNGVRLSASWFMRSLGEQCLVLEAPPWLTPESAAAQVRNHPDVSGVSTVGRFRVLGDARADPYAQLQAESLALPLATVHRASTGRGVSIAVVDTGLDVTHPELAGRIARAVDFVGQARGKFTGDFHGTAVAGVIAAVEGNGLGGAGIAPEAEIWALRACWQEPTGATTAACDSYTLAQALDLVVVETPQILNLSLAGERDALIERLVRAALERGVVVVAAAEGAVPSFPASIPGVIAVYSAERMPQPGATAVDGTFAAPGVDLLTTVPDGGYDFVSGSSFAAAWTSGVVALLLERQPGLAPATMVELLLATAVQRGDAGRRVDPCAALARLTETAACGEDDPSPPGRFAKSSENLEP